MSGCAVKWVMLAAVIGSIVLAAGSRSTSALAQDSPQTTFRSSASAVAVDVSVRDRSRRAITGLAAADFQVFDNGVLQKVDQVTYGKLPIDVTVALDVSYSVTGALLDRLRRGVVQLMRDLGPQDRLKLVLFNMRVDRTVDYTANIEAVERAIREAAAGGGTALLDALSVSLVSAWAPDRRQLIVVFTDGNDSSSTTTPEMLTQVAQRTRATLTFVVPSSAAPFPGFSTIDAMGRMVVTASQLKRASLPPLYGTFSTLAKETGGAVLPVGPNTDLSTAFRNILRDFRSAYVLYYTARGVEGAGYHAIDVKVNREGAQVQARRGYFGS